MEKNEKIFDSILLFSCLSVLALLVFFGIRASQRNRAINEVISRVDKIYDANVAFDKTGFVYYMDGDYVSVSLLIRGSIGLSDLVKSAFLETSLLDIDWNHYCDLADEIMARLETRFGLWWVKSPEVRVSLEAYVIGEDGIPKLRTVADYQNGTWTKYFENWQNPVSAGMKSSVLSLVYRRKETFV